MKNIIWYMFAGTRGGMTRAKMIQLLKKNPSNANKIKESLSIDYKTVRHHLKVLEKNNMIYALNKEKYGAVYFITEQLQTNIEVFDDIWKRIGSNLGKR